MMHLQVLHSTVLYFFLKTLVSWLWTKWFLRCCSFFRSSNGQSGTKTAKCDKAEEDDYGGSTDEEPEEAQPPPAVEDPTKGKTTVFKTLDTTDCNLSENNKW